MTVSLVMLLRTLAPGTRLAGSIELVAIEIGFAAIGAVRLFLVGAALRFDVSFGQATALVIASVTAAAIGFLPSGLGVREGIAAILSPIVGMPAAVGLVITAVERVIGLVVLSLFAGIVTLLTRKQAKTAEAG